MPSTISRCCTSRKSVLSLLLLLFFSVLLSFLVPQRFSTPPTLFAKWQQTHQAWLPVTESLGLHRLFTAPWFVALLFCFLLSLAFTSLAQFRLAAQKTFGLGFRPPFSSSAKDERQEAPFGESLLTEEELVRTLQRHGFFRVAGNDRALRFVKHPWGYWGNFLLHLGILVVVAASLFIAATEKRGIVRLAEGETHTPDSPWLYEEHGLFAAPLTFPEALRLGRVIPEFWPQGGVRNVRSEVAFITPDGATTNRVIAITPILSHRGLRIYQEDNFGRAFHVVLTDDAGQQGLMILDLSSPINPKEASYGNFDFEEIPYRVKAKYYADAGKKTLVSDTPLLVVRLVDDQQRVVGELPLLEGQSGRLGPYMARLVAVKQWTEFVFLDTTGMIGVFFGFFIIILGGTLHYFTIPREIHAQKNGATLFLAFKGSRFQHLYREEGKLLLSRITRQETP